MIYKVIKRFLDILISLIAIIVLAPVFLLLVLSNLIFMGTPIFFVQDRIGKNGVPFKMIKFRSMLNENGNNSSLESDKKRLTKYGVFLRSTSLDEIPELFNILLGKMSFIGPRPLPSYYVPYYIDDEFRRHAVRGGLIPCDGLSKKTTPSWEEQFEFDLLYVDKMSFLLDLKILFITFVLLFKRTKKKYGVIERPHLSEYRKELKDG